MRYVPFFLILMFLSTGTLVAQNKDALAGNYSGVIKIQGSELRIFLKAWINEQDSLEAFFVSPDQGVERIDIDEISRKEGGYLLKSKSIRAFFKGRFNADSTMLEGEWNQAFMTFPLVFERVKELPAVRRPQTPVAPFPYVQKDLAIPVEGQGLTLAGTLSLPSDTGVYPAVVLLTGSGPQDRDESLLGHKPFAVIADYLTRAGYAVFCYDDRGTGKSEGKFASATTLDFATDAEAVFRFLQNHKALDKTRIGLLGHSEGALVAGIVASRNPEVAFVILLAGPGVKGQEVILAQTELIARAEGTPEKKIKQDIRTNRKIYDIALHTPNHDKAFAKIRKIFLKNLDGNQMGEAMVDQSVMQVVSRWFLLFLDLDPAPYYAAIKKPILALNGSLDLQVPPGQNLEAIRKTVTVSGNPNASFIELPGLNHLFQHAASGSVTEYARLEETIAPEVLGILADWITKTIGPAGTN